MSSKQQAVVEWIVNKGEGYKASGMEIHNMVLALEVSPATIRRAVAALVAAGAYDDADGFCGRWVKPAELAAFVRANDREDIGLFLSGETLWAAARQLQTTAAKLTSAVEWAETSGVVTVEYGYYGNYVRLTA